MIWVFGDSFFAGPSTWVNDLSCIDSIQNFAHPGSSLGFTYHQYDDQVKNFKPNDIVIVGLTISIRRYFCVNRPSLTNPLSIEYNQTTNEQQNTNR